MINVVDLMRLQPERDTPTACPTATRHLLHPGQTDRLRLHGYPWPDSPPDLSPHQPTATSTFAATKEEGTITTAFDMPVLNENGPLHLVMDVVDRLPHLGGKSAYIKQFLP